jgi:hypothetical protein
MVLHGLDSLAQVFSARADTLSTGVLRFRSSLQAVRVQIHSPQAEMEQIGWDLQE